MVLIDPPKKWRKSFVISSKLVSELKFIPEIQELDSLLSKY